MDVGTRLKIGLFFFMSCSVPGQAQERYGGIAGRVEFNSLPVLDATVLALDKDGHVQGKSFTDSSGWFIIKQLDTNQRFLLKTFHKGYDTSLVIEDILATTKHTRVRILMFRKGINKNGVAELYAVPLIPDSAQKKLQQVEKFHSY